MLKRVPTLVLLAAQAAPTLPSVDELLARNLASRGGAERLASVRSMRLTGTMTVGPGQEAPVTIEMKRPNKVRLEFRVQGMTGVQAFDGTVAWQLPPYAARDAAQRLPEDETAAVRTQSDFDGPLVGWREKGLDVKVVARETLADAAAWHLGIAFPDGSSKEVWLDAESCLERKSETRRRVAGETVVGESLVSDYRDVEGLVLAHAFENGPKGGRERQKLVITEVELNPQLDDARFSMPGRE
ncbi:MAG TPA: hypothetical protein VFM88_20290 [Vicinamibacteria bacterium]|nr:hypothetical protein [Vicinamibacteria bacterium]